eukprot:Clim_evm34s147 gene=Clim_evmTU34s147
MADAARPRAVVKVGGSGIVDEKRQVIRSAAITNAVELVMRLRSAGYDVILVSSGSINLGLLRMGMSGDLNEASMNSVPMKQTLAAIGQNMLMSTWSTYFEYVGVKVAQVMVSRATFGELAFRKNANRCVAETLKLGAVPIVNENDTTSTEELSYGDNDPLAALLAVHLGAKWLFLLANSSAVRASEDSDRLYHHIPNIEEAFPGLQADSRKTRNILGGMATKIAAARLASAYGIHTGIVSYLQTRSVSPMMDYQAALDGKCRAPAHESGTLISASASVEDDAEHDDHRPARLLADFLKESIH